MKIRTSNSRRFEFVLIENIFIKTSDYGLGYGEFRVPAGFHTDGASTPRAVWSIVPPFGRYLEAAVVHDYFYRNRTSLTRKAADRLFINMMEHAGVPWWKRKSMYFAVRAFGRSSWRF